jgi:ribonuclease HII
MAAHDINPTPTFQIEADLIERGLGPVCGIDEAGRGPWSGPVVAAAVILDPDNIPDAINDSKKLSHIKREALFNTIQHTAQVGVGIVEVEDIDRLNILQATFLAMRTAVEDLKITPAVALIDGTGKPGLTCEMQTLIKGDQRSLSIAAASIIAKVSRDRIMEELALQFPHYGWERNKGYGTAAHRAGLKSHGVSIHHRESFKPIQKLLTGLIEPLP